MSTSKSLKEQNTWLIRVVLLVHALAFTYVVLGPLPFSGPGVLETGGKIQALLVPGSLSLGIIAIARILLLGLVPPLWRDRLVHWRGRTPLPGSRAFTKIGPADSRVDMARLKSVYGPFPTEPEEQSQRFYAIYKEHAEDVGVLDAHKSYLAARDIATINLVLLILLPPLAFWATHSLPRTAIYTAFLLLAYLLMCIAAQIYGTRLVQNSLAVASAK